jgi:D-glycero-alpha-D-manno-heptose-7-phosphate kinase
VTARASRAPDESATIVARAPTRLDFGGGWTDVPPYCEEQGGFVCNIAIARYATVALARAPGEDSVDALAGMPGSHGAHGGEHALARAALRRAGLASHATRLTSDYPVGAGLGGSSAAGVALVGACRALAGQTLDDRAAIAEQSRAIEVEDLGIAGGRQDHYAAAFGGALGLAFTDRTTVDRISLGDETVAALERRLVVGYTGESRISAATITGVLDAYRSRERRVTAALARMAALARLMADALRGGDIDALGALVGEHWTHQRSLHAGITTPRIEAAMAAAMRAGASGGKALGASGGGCVMVIAASGREDEVRRALATVIEPLDVRVDRDGLTVRGATGDLAP